MEDDYPYCFQSTFSTAVDFDFEAAFEADFDHASRALSAACSVFERDENWAVSDWVAAANWTITDMVDVTEIHRQILAFSKEEDDGRLHGQRTTQRG